MNNKTILEFGFRIIWRIMEIPDGLDEEIITNQQSGFRCCTRPLISPVLSVLEATDSWVFDLDRDNVNAVVFLDFKKAFDTVDHAVLLAKVSLYGIEESAYDWSKSYLENGIHKCVVNGHGSLSKVCSLGCGVPQGTILGPLLFLIYINDLPNCLSFCQPGMCAGDTHITYAGADLHSMQSSLNRDSVSNITGRPPSVSGGRCWLKSEQRSFVIYRRNTYEQYGAYNLFQNAEFKANFLIKV